MCQYIFDYISSVEQNVNETIHEISWQGFQNQQNILQVFEAELNWKCASVSHEYSPVQWDSILNVEIQLGFSPVEAGMEQSVWQS